MYDVIVVGGGIGGAAAAYFLGRADQQVLVLEKEALPRCKACGGSAQIRFSPLPFSLSKHIPLALPGISSNAVRETRPAQGKIVGGSSE
ncbi:MAG: FAD-dependent oxidoreductase [Anaerolineales bacterium]|nr:MAG: FAD-dependent oxidoreductase [Anaerolineales bacterium]